MSDKDVAMETLRHMPESVTLEQISEEIAILAAIHKGEAAADAGQVTPHAEVRQQPASTLSKHTAERKQWIALGLQSLARAYGEDEPVYTMADLRP